MSTKTTFKRIALVAVAALGFGTLSVVPSSAADLLLAQEAAFRTGTFMSAPATATIGTPVSATFRITGSCLLDGNFAYNDGLVPSNNYFFDVKASYTTQLDVAPVGTNLLTNSVDVVATVPTGYANSNANTLRYAADGNNGFRNTLQGECLNNTAPLTAYGSVTFTPDVAGTYVIVALPLNATTPAATWTVVASARAAVSAAASTSVLAGVGAVGTNWFGAGEVISSSRAVVAPVANATVTVTLGNGSTGSPLRTQDVTGLTASISGPGTLSWDNAPTNYGRAITRTAASLTPVLNIYADGNAGVSTITIAMGSTIISTETITFFGAPATVVSTVVNSIVAATGGSATGAVTAKVTDSNGNPVAGVTLYATSDTAAVISNSNTASTAVTTAAGVASFDLTPVTLGTAKITVGSTNSATTSINAAPVTVRSGSTTVAGIKFSLDATDYSPGQAAVLTVSFTDAAGLPVANGLQVASLMSSNIGSSIALTGAALPAVSGVALALTNSAGTLALPINMPVTSGEVTISAGTLIGTVAGTASVKAMVSNAEIAAAQDAAAEATDAANAATDAANAAAEAADAATAAAQDAADAVAALSTEVAAMITALKKQITALTNLVIKIQKKVKA